MTCLTATATLQPVVGLGHGDHGQVGGFLAGPGARVGGGVDGFLGSGRLGLLRRQAENQARGGQDKDRNAKRNSVFHGISFSDCP